jgi:hypothetical protein
MGSRAIPIGRVIKRPQRRTIEERVVKEGAPHRRRRKANLYLDFELAGQEYTPNSVLILSLGPVRSTFLYEARLSPSLLFRHTPPFVHLFFAWQTQHRGPGTPSYHRPHWPNTAVKLINYYTK